MRAIGLLRFAIVAASAFALAPPARAGGFHIGKDCAFVLVDDDDCTLRLRARHQGSTWKIRAEGCFEISADENDIVEIPLGGYFRAEERRLGRTRRSIEIRRGTGGVLERRYVRDGKPAAFDDEAREWMVQALRTVFRHTDFGRDKHIERVLERDGIDAALDEIAQIDSDHRSRKAYDEGLARPRPAGGPEQIAREAYARGLEALEARAYQDAVDNMRAAVHHAPAEARYHAGLGIALSRNPRWIRDAIGEMERAIALEPGQPAFQAALAELYHRQGLTIRARRTLEAALAQAPSDPQLLRVARLIAGGEP